IRLIEVDDRKFSPDPPRKLERERVAAHRSNHDVSLDGHSVAAHDPDLAAVPADGPDPCATGDVGDAGRLATARIDDRTFETHGEPVDRDRTAASRAASVRV